MTRMVDFTTTNAIVWRPGEDPVTAWRRCHRARKAYEDIGVVAITTFLPLVCSVLGVGAAVAVPGSWQSGLPWTAAAIVGGGTWAVARWHRIPGRMLRWWTDRCHRRALRQLAQWTVHERRRELRAGAASDWAWIDSADVPAPHQATMRDGCVALERLRQHGHDGFLPASTVDAAHWVVWASCARLHSAQALRANVAAQQRIATSAGDRAITTALTRAEEAEANALEWLACVLRAARAIKTSRGDTSALSGSDPEALRMELDTLLHQDQNICVEFEAEATRTAADGVRVGVDAAIELADSSRRATRYHEWRPYAPGFTAP